VRIELTQHTTKPVRWRVACDGKVVFVGTRPQCKSVAFSACELYDAPSWWNQKQGGRFVEVKVKP
jgi:hypothetical protein